MADDDFLPKGMVPSWGSLPIEQYLIVGYTIPNLSVYDLSFADSSAEKLESLRDRRVQPAAAATNTLVS
jgi:hypothetical protein